MHEAASRCNMSRCNNVAVVDVMRHTYNLLTSRGKSRSESWDWPINPKSFVSAIAMTQTPCVPEELRDLYDVVTEKDALQAFAQLEDEQFQGLFVVSPHLNKALQIGRLLQNERILVGMPDGVVLLDPDNAVLWGNRQFRQWCGDCDVAGQNFYTALGNPEILGPDFCPFHTALATGQASSSTLRVGENQFYEVHAAPVEQSDQPSLHLIVTIRDITEEKLQQQKLAAIHKAGVELANLTPEEVFQMEVDDRIELLKSNILHYTRHLLNFDVIEIRLLDQETLKLDPLLSVGHGAGCGAPAAVRSPAGQRRHRIRRGHRQELFVRRHDRRPPLHRRRLTVPRVR